jgi:branched-chain amino acid transport system substrate-binding protein
MGRRTIITAVFSLVFAGLFSSSPSTAQELIKLGVSAPLSGPSATFGTDLRNIITFANQTLANNRYTIVVEDDHCDGKDAMTVARKLVAIDGVKAAFFACDTAALVAAPAYRARNVLVVTPLVTSPRFSTLGPTFFRLAPNDVDNARILVSHISSHHHKLGILTEAASEYCEDLAAEVEKAAHDKRLQLVHERFGPDTSDFKSLLLRLQSRGIDSLFINPTSEEAFLIILKQLRQLGITLPIFGSYTPGSATFLKNAGSLAEGIVYTDFPSPPRLTDSDQKLLAEFKQQFGPLNTWDVLFASGIESFRIVHEALQSGGDPAEYIHKTQFHGLLGSYSFSAHGDITGISNELKQVRGGRGISLSLEIAGESRS